jgi:hypothetical protein
MAVITNITFAENFELGTFGVFDAETDTGSLLDFPHYTELARFGQAPYRGAYCMRLRLAGATDAYVQENSAYDLAAAAVHFTAGYFYIGKNFVMADTDKFAMFNLESVADTTVIVACGLDRSGADIRLWFAATNSSSAQTVVLGSTTTALGKWYHVELRIDVDAGGGNDGTIDGYLNGVAFGSQITALDQGAGVDAKWGAITVDAGTSGTILFDQIQLTIASGTQIYPYRERYTTQNRWSGKFAQDHVLIGPGEFSAAVTGSSTDAVLTLFDTDGVPNGLEPLVVLRPVSATEFTPGHDVFTVNHGLYYTLSGTNAQAFFSITKGCNMSDGSLISYGQRKAKVSP